MATKAKVKAKPKRKRMYWEYHIVKWNSSRTKQLEKHTMVVQRATEYNARTIVRKKYPYAKGYREELNNSWYK